MTGKIFTCTLFSADNCIFKHAPNFLGVQTDSATCALLLALLQIYANVSFLSFPFLVARGRGKVQIYFKQMLLLCCRGKWDSGAATAQRGVRGSKSKVIFTILLMSPTQAQVVLPLEFWIAHLEWSCWSLKSATSWLLALIFRPKMLTTLKGKPPQNWVHFCAPKAREFHQLYIPWIFCQVLSQKTKILTL